MFTWRKLPADRPEPGLAFILPLIAMLAKEPEQPDAFFEHTIQQNATAVRTPPRTPLGDLTALRRQTTSWF